MPRITGAKIKQARERLGESQAEFAGRFGVTQPTIHNWETSGPPKRGAAAFAIERILAELQEREQAA